MVTCPSCGSSRIRNDYKPAPIVLRVIGIRALLCDNCNYQFRAFSPLSPKNRRQRNSARKADVFNANESVDLGKLNFHSAPAERREPVLALPISANPNHSVQPMQMDMAVAGVQSQSRIVIDQLAPARHNLRTEITKLYEQNVRVEAAVPEADRSSMTCPECGSGNIKRRKRNMFEKVFLSVTDHKSYVCRKCDTAFYSKSAEKD